MRWISAAAAVFLLFFSMEARAFACAVNLVAVNFGAFSSSIIVPLETDGAVQVTCALNVPYLIRLDAGGNSGGSFLPRKMRLGARADTFNYNLYRDSARTEIWGDGTGKTYTLGGTGMGVVQNLIVYGRIYGGQTIVPGSYSDAITVTIEW